MHKVLIALLACWYTAVQANPVDHLVTAGSQPYVITATTSRPTAVVVVMPGGQGRLIPKLGDQGQVVVFDPDNFAIRIRHQLVDSDTVVAATDSTVATGSTTAVLAVIGDLRQRYPGAKIYVLSTSRGSRSILELALARTDGIAGYISTAGLDAVNRELAHRQLPGRYLLVHHRYDRCRTTSYSAAAAAADQLGLPLVTVEGGGGTGDPCGPQSEHGFLGREELVVGAVKAWIRSH